jgi:hypothetical protein
LPHTRTLSEALTLILPPKPIPPDPIARLRPYLQAACQSVCCVLRIAAANALAPPEPARLFPSLYLLLGQDAIQHALAQTGTTSRRLRRLPAHEVVWLVIAQSWFPQRSIPKVWRHIHPSPDVAEPVDSAFTQARQRLGARALQLLFHRTCRPLSAPGCVGAFHRGWLIVALDGSVFEAPDTPVNRKTLGSASNQHSEGAFPQLRLAAICEVGTHAVTDVEMGPY